MFVSHHALAQTNIDTFLNTLHNKDVRSRLELVEHRGDSGKFYGSVVEWWLTSIDLSKVRKAYPKYVMIEKLVGLLDDPERDWYADILLYDLTLVPALNLISCDTREKWLEIEKNGNSTYKELDKAFWNHYLAVLSPSDDY